MESSKGKVLNEKNSKRKAIHCQFIAVIFRPIVYIIANNCLTPFLKAIALECY